jgi:hypothetical protein
MWYERIGKNAATFFAGITILGENAEFLPSIGMNRVFVFKTFRVIK